MLRWIFVSRNFTSTGTVFDSSIYEAQIRDCDMSNTAVTFTVYNCWFVSTLYGNNRFVSGCNSSRSRDSFGDNVFQTICSFTRYTVSSGKEHRDILMRNCSKDNCVLFFIFFLHSLILIEIILTTTSLWFDVHTSFAIQNTKRPIIGTLFPCV